MCQNRDITPLFNNQLPTGMVTLLRNKSIVPDNFLNGINNNDQLEQLIFDKICSYREGDNLKDIFCMIHVWGGMAGRQVFIGNRFDWERISPYYIRFINGCLEVRDNSEASIARCYEILSELINNVKYLGTAFGTKHMRFWLYKNLRCGTLPIYDRKMAESIMQDRYTRLSNVPPYWHRMKELANEEHKSLLEYEREIYNTL